MLILVENHAKTFPLTFPLNRALGRFSWWSGIPTVAVCKLLSRVALLSCRGIWVCPPSPPGSQSAKGPLALICILWRNDSRQETHTTSFFSFWLFWASWGGVVVVVCVYVCVSAETGYNEKLLTYFFLVFKWDLFKYNLHTIKFNFFFLL